jgi:ABC-type transport system involved in multi-copper enzyme maturation permease subunit
MKISHAIIKRVFATLAIATLIVLGIGLLIIALSGGNANAQKGGVFLVFAVFLPLLGLTVLSFLALLGLDVEQKSPSSLAYVLLAFLVAAFLMLPVILTGRFYEI